MLEKFIRNSIERKMRHVTHKARLHKLVVNERVKVKDVVEILELLRPETVDYTFNIRACGRRQTRKGLSPAEIAEDLSRTVFEDRDFRHTGTHAVYRGKSEEYHYADIWNHERGESVKYYAGNAGTYSVSFKIPIKTG